MYKNKTMHGYYASPDSQKGSCSIYRYGAFYCAWYLVWIDADGEERERERHDTLVMLNACDINKLSCLHVCMT